MINRRERVIWGVLCLFVAIISFIGVLKETPAPSWMAWLIWVYIFGAEAAGVADELRSSKTHETRSQEEE